MAQRYLAYHKDPLYKGSFSLRGRAVRRYQTTVRVPASHLRAGEAYYIEDLDLTIFAREVKYDVDTDTVTITPDLPPDNSTMELPKVAGVGGFVDLTR